MMCARLPIAALAICSMCLVACNNREQESAAAPTSPPVVKTVRVEPTDIEDTLTIPARVQADPARVVREYPPAGGRLVRVSARPGDHVTKGETLAVLESSDVAQARADFTHAALAGDPVSPPAGWSTINVRVCGHGPHNFEPANEPASVRSTASNWRGPILVGVPLDL